MSETARIVRFDELIPDEKIHALIEKYSFGAEVWWQRVFSEVQQSVVDPDSGRSGKVTLPVTKIYLGTRGVLFGPEYYIWFAVVVDAIPSEEKLEKAIANALESMRERKAQQANIQN